MDLKDTFLRFAIELEAACYAQHAYGPESSQCRAAWARSNETKRTILTFLESTYNANLD